MNVCIHIESEIFFMIKLTFLFLCNVCLLPQSWTSRKKIVSTEKVYEINHAETSFWICAISLISVKKSKFQSPDFLKILN